MGIQQNINNCLQTEMNIKLYANKHDIEIMIILYLY